MMVRLRRAALFMVSLTWITFAMAQERVLVAAAANTQPAMTELVAAFQHDGVRIEPVFGSSGKLSTQIRNGAPFQLFFSADEAFAQALIDDGHAIGPTRLYALGRLALWSARHDAQPLRLEDLTRPDFARIAIANPRHAPYGQRAEEALRAVGIWKVVEPKLVYGESIAQTAQFAQSGNADIGIVALSQALYGELVALGGHALIPDHLHAPLRQAYVVTHSGIDSLGVRAFIDFLSTPEAREIFTRHGFGLPDPDPAP